MMDMGQGVGVLTFLGALLTISLIVAERWRRKTRLLHALDDRMAAIRQDHEQWAVYYGEWNRRYVSKQPTTPVIDTRSDPMHFEREQASLADRSSRSHFAAAVAEEWTPGCDHPNAVGVMSVDPADLSAQVLVAKWCPDCTTQILVPGYDHQWPSERQPEVPWTCHDCPNEDEHPHPSRNSAAREESFQRAQRALRRPTYGYLQKCALHPGIIMLDGSCPTCSVERDTPCCETCNKPHSADVHHEPFWGMP